MSARAAAWTLFAMAVLSLLAGAFAAALWLGIATAVVEAWRLATAPTPDQLAARRRSRPAPVFQARPRSER